MNDDYTVHDCSCTGLQEYSLFCAVRDHKELAFREFRPWWPAVRRAAQERRAERQRIAWETLALYTQSLDARQSDFKLVH
jgi:hypothetical protein